MSVKTTAKFLNLSDWEGWSDEHENSAFFLVVKSWGGLSEGGFSWAQNRQLFLVCLNSLRSIKQCVWIFQCFISGLIERLGLSVDSENFSFFMWWGTFSEKHENLSIFCFVLNFRGGLSNERENFSVFFFLFNLVDKDKAMRVKSQHFFLL